MLNGIKVTLYEIFGYLLPGLVALLGFAALIWTLFYTHAVLDLSGSPGQLFYALVLLVAYFCGHMVQSIGNSVFSKSYEQECLEAVPCKDMEPLEKWFYWKRVFRLAGLSKSKPRCLPDNIVKLIKGKLGRTLGTEVENIHPSVLFAICDEWLIQSDRSGDREVYQYREGFYRGLAISLFLLSVALAIHTITGPAILKVMNGIYEISQVLLVLFALITFWAARLSFLRYERFARYRVHHAFLSYLVSDAVKQYKIGQQNTGIKEEE